MVDWQGDKPKMARTPKNFRKLIKRWHASWRDDNHVVLGRAPSARGWLVGNKVGQRKPGFYGVHLQKVPLVRDQLYEWFLSMRYSIDWKRLNQEARSRGDRNAIGRFLTSVLETKLQELLRTDAEKSLRHVATLRDFERGYREGCLRWGWIKVKRLLRGVV